MALSKKAPPSLAFSGAGFLTSYHLGVVECLRRHGVVNKDDYNTTTTVEKSDGTTTITSYRNKQQTSMERPMILSGVSGGALAVTSIVLDIQSDDAMSITMNIAQKARNEGGILDHLHPR